MAMELKLFHRIGEGGADSAAVRQFLVEHQFNDMIEFFNVANESAQKKLIELVGQVEAPVLVVNGRPVRGRELIIDWLKTNLLRLRD